MKKTVRVNGEFAGTTAGWDRQKLLKQWQEGKDFKDLVHTVAPLAPLNAILAANYPAYTTLIPDVARARIYLNDVAAVATKRPDAESDDPSAAFRSHQRHASGSVDTESDGRGQ